MTSPLVREALVSLKDSIPLYLENNAYYTGQREEVFASERIAHDLSPTGSRYRVNFCPTVVKAIVDRLEASGILCSDDSVREYLDEVWADNFFDAELKDAMLKASVFGDGYIISWPDEETESGIASYSHNPMNVRVFYEELRPRRKSHAAHIAAIYGTGTGDDGNGLLADQKYLLVTLYFRDRIEQHVSDNPMPSYGTVNFETVSMHLLDEHPNPFGIIPVIHLRQTSRPYGTSDIELAKGPQDSITKIFITMMTAIDRSGYKQRYEIAGKTSEFTDHLSAAAPDSDQPLVATSYKAGPDTVHRYVGDNVSVGQFEASESSNFFTAIDEILAWLSRITGIPTQYFSANAEALSGIAYKRAEAPLIKKCEDRQVLYGEAMKELFYHWQLMGKQRVVDAELNWAPITVADTSEEWDIGITKTELGVPRAVVLTELGYDRSDIDSWLEVGAEVAGEIQNRSPEAVVVPDEIPDFEV